jgi:3-methyladenine DNA glycosylase AlkC
MDWKIMIFPLNAIEELTKRNTGEYAIRPFIKQYPTQTLQQMKQWAKSDNFHCAGWQAKD